MEWSVNANGPPGTMQAFATLSSSIFQAHFIQSRAENRIAFSCASKNLVQAMDSGKQAMLMSLRLIKMQGQSYLSCKVRAIDVDVVQNVSITVMSVEQFQHHAAPYVPQASVAMEVHQRVHVKKVVDRMKMMHREVKVWGHVKGELRVGFSSDGVSSETVWRGLKIRSELQPDVEPQEEACVTMDAKVWAKALQVMMNPGLSHPESALICCTLLERTLTLEL